MLVRLSPKPPDVFIAPRPCELISSIPEHTYTAGTDRSWRRILHILVPDCTVGECLHVEARFEITNDTGENVEISGGLILTPDASGTAGMETLMSVSNGQEPPNARMMTPMDGENCTPGMHHLIVQRACHFIVPEGFGGDQYVAMVAYAAGGGSIGAPRSVAVEPYCGAISVCRTGGA